MQKIEGFKSNPLSSIHKIPKFICPLVPYGHLKLSKTGWSVLKNIFKLFSVMTNDTKTFGLFSTIPA